ncbi:MAG: DUF2520 domain-containing protein [Candidatus Aminicenantes bacterium]|nr:DUF2520 domain-containing protein [Candidatus Aminicenantes bacterium]
MRVSIIGGGRLGTSLGRALARSGVSIRAVCDRTAVLAGRARRAIGAGRMTTDPVDAAREADVVFLCLPDDGLAGAARLLGRAARDWRGKTVFHCSGLLSSGILAPLRKRGASVASFHPAQSFPAKGLPPSVFRGITIGLEGDAAARATGRMIARRLGAEPLHLASRDKPLYHAACSLASNQTVVLFHLASELLAGAGMTPRKAEGVLWPLLQGTLRNVKKFRAAGALSGPLTRGDAASVRRHLAALKKHPRLRKVYKLLSLEGWKLVRRSGGSSSGAAALSRLLGER